MHVSAVTKKLFLHIGARKTGSSFLQAMFARNADHFLAQGVYYPLDDRERAIAMKGVATSGNPRSLIGILRPERVSPKTSQFSAERIFLDALEGSPCDKVLVSSELFCGASADSLEHLNSLAGSTSIDMAFIYFVRNPLDHAFSIWTQNIKSGNRS